MTALTDAERLDWLQLTRSPNVGSTAFATLVERFGDPGAALANLPELARRGGRAAPIDLFSRAEAQDELTAGVALGARLVAHCEADYPPLLAALDFPPPLVWMLGEAELAFRPAVAIVGAREASASGTRFARMLAAELGEAGLVVVSGMARGIDAAAHLGSLATGAIGVMAGGVDQAYPVQNVPVWEALRDRGLLVSERAIGLIARAKDFPRRNRLISGLALGIVVVEAELRSGSLITARLAGEQGREVFAVPGSPLDPRARGTNDLLRQGATLVESAEDVLRELAPAVERAKAPPTAPSPVTLEAETDAVRTRLAALLSPTPTSIDELARAAESSLPEALAALTELALAGRAELLPGGLAVAV